MNLILLEHSHYGRSLRDVGIALCSVASGAKTGSSLTQGSESDGHAKSSEFKPPLQLAIHGIENTLQEC